MTNEERKAIKDRLIGPIDSKPGEKVTEDHSDLYETLDDLIALIDECLDLARKQV